MNSDYLDRLHVLGDPERSPLCATGQWNIPTFEILLARSGFLVFFALVGCAIQRQNPLGKRCGCSFLQLACT